LGLFQTKFQNVPGEIFSKLLNSAIQICSGFGTAEKEKDVKEFFESHTLPGTERTIAQTIESIHSNTAFVLRNAEELKKFLK